MNRLRGWRLGWSWWYMGCESLTRFRVEGLGFGVWGLVPWVWGVGCGMWDVGCGVLGFGLSV